MQVNFAINELLATFDRLYDMRACSGPMFESFFRNAMLLLMESGLEDATLTEFSLVFEDADYRKFLKSRCTNPLVVGFWTNQAEKAKGDAALENMAPYIVSKINAFTCNALIRPIVGQAKSTIHLRKILDNRGILLVKLPKGILGALDTQLLGSLLLSKVFATALGRARVKSTERSTFHLYVDEFQNFTNDTVAHILSEARKYGLFLTLANQNLSQLRANPGRQNILDAVLGNVGSLIAFRIGPSDAEKLWPYTEPEFGSLDLQGLPNYHAVGRLLTAQGPTRPFVFRTLPPTRPRGYKRAGAEAWAIKERSFARPIAEVEAEILRRRTAHKNTDSPKIIGKAPLAEVLGRSSRT
jgi:tRNA isopentenyl-2-thiomethyl-A-37 hydroxylase MiaE